MNLSLDCEGNGTFRRWNGRRNHDVKKLGVDITEVGTLW